LVRTGAFWCKITALWLKLRKQCGKAFQFLPRGSPGSALAERQKTSANRVLVDLIEAGLQSKEAEKERFFALAEKMTQTKDPKERKRLRDELAVLTLARSSNHAAAFVP